MVVVQGDIQILNTHNNRHFMSKSSVMDEHGDRREGALEIIDEDLYEYSQ